MTVGSSHRRRRLGGLGAVAALALSIVLGALAPSALAGSAYVANSHAESVSVVETGTNRLLTTIFTGGSPEEVAIAPDGKTAYVTDSDAEAVKVIETAGNRLVGPPIPAGKGPSALAVTPDGSRVYVTESGSSGVAVIDTATKRVIANLEVGEDPVGIAITPNGKTAYVVNRGDRDVSVIDVASGRVAPLPIALGEGTEPAGIAIAPDGSAAYVADGDAPGTVSVIDTATNSLAGTIPLAANDPVRVAISPDGATAYVADNSEEGLGGVSLIDTGSRTSTQTLAVPEPPQDLAVTPDGSRVLVTRGKEASNLFAIETASNRLSPLVSVGSEPRGLAIVPAQTPAPSFIAVAGTVTSPVFFDASASSDSGGSIARYDWSFGDGQSAANAGQLVNHRYSSPGTYQVTLTVDDGEGCPGVVYTGQTASCAGPSLASQTQTVTVLPPPNNFGFGPIHRNTHKGIAKLRVHFPAVGFMELRSKKVRIIQRKVRKAGTVTLTLRPKRREKKRLIRRHRDRVSIRLTFTPTDGVPRTKAKGLLLIHRRHHR